METLKSRSVKYGLTALVLSTLLSLLTACNTSDSEETAAAAAEVSLKQFDSCDELKSYLITTASVSLQSQTM